MHKDMTLILPPHLISMPPSCRPKNISLDLPLPHCSTHCNSFSKLLIWPKFNFLNVFYYLILSEHITCSFALCRFGASGLCWGLPGPVYQLRDLRHWNVLNPIWRTVHGCSQQVLKLKNIPYDRTRTAQHIFTVTFISRHAETLGQVQVSTNGEMVHSNCTRTSALRKLEPGNTSPLMTRLEQLQPNMDQAVNCHRLS